jgi:hypothetical protein
MTTTTTTTTHRDGPGLKRLRAAPNAETIRAAVLADQQTGRAEALAKIEAEKAADAEAIDLPANFVLGAPQTAADADSAAPASDAPPTAAMAASARRRPASRAPNGWRWRKRASSPHRRTSPRRPTSDSAPRSPP